MVGCACTALLRVLSCIADRIDDRFWADGRPCATRMPNTKADIAAEVWVRSEAAVRRDCSAAGDAGCQIAYTAIPWTAEASGASASISGTVSVMDAAATFSRRRLRLRVPGIGTVLTLSLRLWA